MDCVITEDKHVHHRNKAHQNWECNCAVYPFFGLWVARSEIYLNWGRTQGKQLVSRSLGVSIHVDQNVDTILVNTISCLPIAGNLSEKSDCCNTSAQAQYFLLTNKNWLCESKITEIPIPTCERSVKWWASATTFTRKLVLSSGLSA